MPSPPPEIPHDDGSGRLMPWLIGVIVFLAALATGTVLSLDAALERWDTGLAGTITVQLPRAPDGEALPQETVDRALEFLQKQPGVTRASVLDEASMTRLLRPWVGGVAADALPLPVLVDVRLAPHTDLDLEALGRDLSEIVPGATASAHGAWLINIFKAARMIEFVGLFVLGFMVAATVLSVVFATRTSLLIHRDIVDILHMIGARDEYIAGRFQWHAFRTAFNGGIIGIIFALLTLGCVLYFTESSGAEAMALIPNAGLSFEILVPILLLPGAAGLVGLLTARVTVLRALLRER